MKSKSGSPFWALLVVVICVEAVGIAHAGPLPSTDAQNLSINLAVSCLLINTVGNCMYDVGADPPLSFGGPESGFADFNPIAPGWSFFFQSAPAISYQYQDNPQGYFTYGAEFGSGGNFMMTAPGNLTFTGIVTSGAAYLAVVPGGAAAGVEAFFTGQWSNGVYGHGEADLGGNFDFAPNARLYAVPTPEPRSLTLLSSGIAAIAGVFRRKLLR